MKSQIGCPFCREKIIYIVESKPPAMQGKQVQCDNCGACGPIYETEKEAISGWELGIIHLGERFRTDL